MDKRTILAFVLCGIIALIWFWYMSVQQKRSEEGRRRQEQAQREKKKSAEDGAEREEPGKKPDVTRIERPAEKPAEAELGKPLVAEEVPAKDDITISRDGIKHQTVWTNRGGALLEARLVPTKDGRYRQSVDSEEGVMLLHGLKRGSRTFLLKDSDSRNPFHLDTANYNYNPDYLQSGKPLVFDHTFKRRLRVTKTFTFKPEKYAIDVTIELKNVDPTQTIKNMSYQLLAAARLLPDGPADADLAGLVGYQTGPEKWKFDSGTPATVAKKGQGHRTSSPSKPITWAGATNRYFTGALIARDSDSTRASGLIRSAFIQFLSTHDIVTAENTGMKGSETPLSRRQSWATTSRPAHATGAAGPNGQLDPVLHGDNVTVIIQTKPQDIEPNETLTHKYTYFLGPKKAEFLEEYPGIEGVLDYGVFGFISKILLAILSGLYAVLGNYGVGIIFLTIVVKIILHPLTRKGQISMHKMQKLQPLVQEIQEKYKDDRQRLGREQMDLFRKHGANPMSGCWPLLMQIPVFFGLFNMLRYSVDLRHEGFLWVSDLSRPDTIGVVAGYPLNILPILMVISWVIQQATQPKPADPKQASQRKMMMFLPIVFGFLLYSSPSGLILYWFTSTFLGIFEQKFIKYQIQKMEARGAFPAIESPAAPTKPTRPKGRRR